MNGETVPIEIWKQVNQLTQERDEWKKRAENDEELRRNSEVLRQAMTSARDGLRAEVGRLEERLDQQRALALEEAALHLENSGPDCRCSNVEPNATAAEIRGLSQLRRGLVAVPACPSCQQPLMGPGGAFCSGGHDYGTRMTPELERSIRMRLWLGHGHVGMYGDDGEMQCAECLPYGVSDYKRQSLGELLDGLNALGLERVAKLARKADSDGR